ncbi:MAG: hypothetical protein CK429_34185 [Mycobacterium sp.]|nr:MAG: hypothetical protein CK429_34185 [Mycobacterium sp.]PJE10666.1 MAG: hypothetical protein CK428_15950 [Mycobacterium sp.]PJE25316.1 MAG: hypothetical protein CK431_01145 [Mycobacterium sp.]
MMPMGTMGTKSKLDIETGQLASAGGKATSTQAGSATTAPPSPPSTVTSQLDAALALLATSSTTALAAADTADSAAATRQQAALTQSPPVFVAQDQRGAQDYTRAGASMPTPVMGRGSTGLVPS